MTVNEVMILRKDELIFLVKIEDLSKDFMRQATKELNASSVGFVRKCQTKEYKDAKVGVSAGIFLISLGVVLFIVGLVLTIMIDWGIFISMIIALLISFVGFLLRFRNLKKVRLLEAAINNCDLQFCKIIEGSLNPFTSSLQYMLYYEEKEIIQSSKVCFRMFNQCIRRPYIIVAYEKGTGGSYPLRLFKNRAESAKGAR